LVLFVGLFVVGEARAAEAPADFVLLDGRVHTLDEPGTIATTLAVRDEKVVFVGDDAGVQPFVGPKTEVFRAGGRTVIPGINETHVHALGAAQGEAVQAFRQLGSIGEIQEWIREQASRTSAEEWIRLPRVDVTRIKERRIPTRADLDAAAPDRPAVYVWQYANRQLQVLNTAALRAAGITRDTPQPKGGRIVVDAAGEPTGVVEDAPSLTAKFMPAKKATPDEVLDALEQLHRAYARCGITSITERGSSAEGWRTYVGMRDKKRLLVRSTMTIRIGGDGTAEGTERAIRALPFKFGDGDEWVKIGPLKIGVDGGVLYGTAYLREPYGEASFGLYGLDDPLYRGLLQMDAERVKTVIRTGHKLGWQMSSHVTGDAGVDLVLDAVEAANADAPIVDRRFTLIHAYFPNTDTAVRAAKLGVCVDTQPMWFYKDGDALEAALGRKRMESFIGAAKWRAAGVHTALNSDHMQGFDPDRSLNPFNPFLAMYAAISRKTESGQEIGPAEKVSRVDALKMMTLDAAYLHFDETKKGTLEVGKLGDFAVLSDDFFTCDEAAIPKIHSLLTVVGGRVTHREK
jgi:predicted amidohydrolase YtcJ